MHACTHTHAHAHTCMACTHTYLKTKGSYNMYMVYCPSTNVTWYIHHVISNKHHNPNKNLLDVQTQSEIEPQTDKIEHFNFTNLLMSGTVSVT